MRALPLWLLFAAALVGLLRVSAPATPAPAGLAPCRASPWTLTGPTPPNSVSDGVITLASPSMYAAIQCQPARLTFWARGQLGGGRYPYLDIVNADQRWRVQVSGERAYSFDLRPGAVVLSFDDDFVGDGDRNVFIRDLALR